MKIDVKILSKNPDFKLPQYGTTGSAGLDLSADVDQPLTIMPGEVKLVPTGLSIYLRDPNYVALIMPRSSMGHKKGIILGNTTGVIDSDYQGPLMMSLWNRGTEPYTITPLERVAQLVVVPVMQLSLNVVEDFEATERGEGGFGSTNK